MFMFNVYLSVNNNNLRVNDYNKNMCYKYVWNAFDFKQFDLYRQAFEGMGGPCPFYLTHDFETPKLCGNIPTPTHASRAIINQNQRE